MLEKYNVGIFWGEEIDDFILILFFFGGGVSPTPFVCLNRLVTVKLGYTPRLASFELGKIGLNFFLGEIFEIFIFLL